VTNGTEGVRRYASRHGFPSSGPGALASCTTGKCPHISAHPQADFLGSAGKEGPGEEVSGKEGPRRTGTGEEDSPSGNDIATDHDATDHDAGQHAQARQANESSTPV
jgi:hypothetical protein